MLSCHTLSVVSKLSVVSGGANTPLSHSIKLHMRYVPQAFHFSGERCLPLDSRLLSLRYVTVSASVCGVLRKIFAVRAGVRVIYAHV